MWMRLMALILMMSFVGTQASAMTRATARQAQVAQAAGTLAGAPTATSATTGTIDVPVGTKVPLNLVTQIMSLSTKPGSMVRAVVAFPVTIGNQVAIPAGTFVEGQLVSTAASSGKKAKKTRYGASSGNMTTSSGLQIHFTSLVYANGYTVPLDALNTDASVSAPADGTAVASADESVLQMPAARENGPDGGAAFLEGQFGYPTPPTLPTPPTRPGPNPVAITLGAVGGFVLLTLGAILLAKHASKPVDSVMYDAGWQLSMMLTSPLRLDKAQVMDAAKLAPATP